MRNVNKNVLAGISVVVLVLSFLPLFLLAGYAGPVADDFGYGGPVYYAIQNGSGFVGVIKAIAENLRYTYMHWQGTFSSVLFFSVQPDAFGEGLYRITPFVMLSVILASVYILAGALYCAEGWGRVLLGSTVSLLAVQFLPSAAEGIFWWNGASHYVVSWLLFVLAVTQQIRIGMQKSFGKRFAFSAILGCFLAFFAGGGNYSTALVCAVALSALALYGAVQKKERKVVYAEMLAAVFAIIGLLISMVAPGNAVRQSGFEKMGVISAVLTSFGEACKAVVSFTDITVIGALLLCIPVFLLSLKKRYTFRYPLLVLCGTFCVFSAMYTPPLYAMGVCDVPRMNNMFYLAYLLWIFGNGLYIGGWVYGKFLLGNRAAALKVAAVVGAVVFVFGFSLQAKHTNSFLAYTDLKSDVLQTYTQEITARRAAYRDKTASLRYVPISAYPKAFVPAKHLTWSSDLLLDGVPIDLPIYRSCGGEVTYVGYDDAMAYFHCAEKLPLKDFSKTFYINAQTCVPLREVALGLGWNISYNAQSDTIYIETDQ